MQTNWNGRKITRQEITLHEWVNAWMTHPTQRDHVKRANSPSFRRKMKYRTPKHTEVDGVVCGCDFIDEVTGKQYREGDQIKTDGHGRGYYFTNLLSEGEQPPESMFVSSFVVNSYDELVEAYSWFDSASDVEKANDRVDGAVRAVLHPQGKYITDDRLRKVTPIEYAAAGCFPEEFRRCETSTHGTIVTMVKHLQDALVWLHDEVLPHTGKKIKFEAPLSASYIMSYMKYQDSPEKLNRLKNLIIQVSKGAMNNVEIPMDCASMLVEKWIDEDSPQRGRGVLNGKPQSREMQGFLLLMIDKFVNNIKHEKVPQNWREYYKTWQDEYAKMKSSKGAQTSLIKQLSVA